MASHDCRTVLDQPARRPGRGWLRIAAVVATGVVLLPACTSGGQPNDDGATSIPAAPPSVTPPASETPAADDVSIEFKYEVPEPPCPPASDLGTLPLAETHPYAADPSFLERDHSLKSWCRYQRADLADGGEDMILEDHALITSEIALYRDWGDSDWFGTYPELPVASDNLDDWSIAIWARDDPRIRWEGCGPATPCGDGESPTVRTYALRTRFRAHVGNLEFYVRVSYIAEELPADARERTIEIFRDLVLTVVDSRERAD